MKKIFALLMVSMLLLAACSSGSSNGTESKRIQKQMKLLLGHGIKTLTSKH